MNLIPLAHRDKIQRIPGVKVSLHNNWFGGIYQDEKNFFPQFVSIQKISAKYVQS